MNPIQESKQELEAAIRYAENAISSANKTIESLATQQEQTGREEVLTKQVQELNATVQFHVDREAGFLDQIKDLEKEVQRQQDLGQGYYDSMMTFKEKADSLAATIRRLNREQPTMPVIPKAVAIAIFREGMAYGAGNVCDELDNADDIEISDNERMGNFEVEFQQWVTLSDHLDLDWLRAQAVDNSDEEWVVNCLKTLCADNEFECRIHGVDDQGDDSKSA